MTYPVRRRAQANQELLEHVDRIADGDPDAALRFIDAIESALTHLSAHPEMASIYDADDGRLVGIRQWVLAPPFSKYLLFYRFEKGAVHLLHILRTERDIGEILGNG